MKADALRALPERLQRAIDWFHDYPTPPRPEPSGWTEETWVEYWRERRSESLKAIDEARLAFLGEARDTEPCVCQVDDGLVQEWVSKAREVAKGKKVANDGQGPRPARPEERHILQCEHCGPQELHGPEITRQKRITVVDSFRCPICNRVLFHADGRRALK